MVGSRFAVLVTARCSCSREKVHRMATPTAAVKSTQGTVQAELEEELRQAEEDFARGDFVELTIEELDACIAAGEWPWQRASCD